MSLKHARKAPHQLRHKPGVKPDEPSRWTSGLIMAMAGHKGFLPMRQSRKICGYKHTSGNKYA